jgi:hypothetical protein
MFKFFTPNIKKIMGNFSSFESFMLKSDLEKRLKIIETMIDLNDDIGNKFLFSNSTKVPVSECFKVLLVSEDSVIKEKTVNYLVKMMIQRFLKDEMVSLIFRGIDVDLLSEHLSGNDELIEAILYAGGFKRLVVWHQENAMRGESIYGGMRHCEVSRELCEWVISHGLGLEALIDIIPYAFIFSTEGGRHLYVKNAIIQIIKEAKEVSVSQEKLNKITTDLSELKKHNFSNDVTHPRFGDPLGDLLISKLRAVKNTNR